MSSVHVATPGGVHVAVLGDPVAHSLSPLLHTAAYDALGLTDWCYHAIRCGAADLGPMLARVRDSGRWAGLSLTMPLKEVAVPLLDEVRGGLGVVNTVLVRDGRLVGENTDPDGVRAGLAALGWDGGPVAILGAGGTARAALAAVAGRASEVTLHVRSAPRAAGAVALAEQLGLGVTVFGMDAVPPATVVSTLPASAPAVPVHGPLLDVVYAPWPTRTAAAAPGPVVSGLEVLLGQAARQVELLTGRPAPLAAMRALMPVVPVKRTAAAADGEEVTAQAPR